LTSIKDLKSVSCEAVRALGDIAMHDSADMPTRSEPMPTGWMAFCEAVRKLEKRDARSGERIPVQDERTSDAH